MLYNENGKKFIFIHIPKCAGTSIERYFGKDYDNIKKDTHTYFEIKNNIAHSKHFRLSDYSKVLSDNDLKNYYKFTFIRNPYDLIVSKFRYIKTNPNSIIIKNKEDIADKITFDDYVNILYNNRNKPIHNKSVNVTNFDEWIKCENIELDFIGKVENMDNDFKIICNELGFKYKKLNKINKSNRVSDYRYYYNDKTKKLITELFKDDLEKYNYRF